MTIAIRFMNTINGGRRRYAMKRASFPSVRSYKIDFLNDPLNSRTCMWRPRLTVSCCRSVSALANPIGKGFSRRVINNESVRFFTSSAVALHRRANSAAQSNYFSSKMTVTAASGDGVAEIYIIHGSREGNCSRGLYACRTVMQSRRDELFDHCAFHSCRLRKATVLVQNLPGGPFATKKTDLSHLKRMKLKRILNF